MSSAGPCHPNTPTKPISPAFPLTQNGLQDIFRYDTPSFGQISVTSATSRPRGSHLCYILAHSATPNPTRSSFQTSSTTHAEFNSALVYMDHSCSPTVEIEVYEPGSHENHPEGAIGEVRVVGNRDLDVGDELTWFYPSTEWESVRPVQCFCGVGKHRGGKRCIGFRRGSKYLARELLQKYFINKHVLDLVAKRDQI